MTTDTDREDDNELPTYEAPKLWVLDAAQTKTGPDPDPTELNTFFEMS